MAELGFPVLPLLALGVADFPTPPPALFAAAAAALDAKRAQDAAAEQVAAAEAAAGPDPAADAASAAGGGGADEGRGGALPDISGLGLREGRAADVASDPGSAAARTAGVASSSGRGAGAAAGDPSSSGSPQAAAAEGSPTRSAKQGWATRGEAWTFPPADLPAGAADPSTYPGVAVPPPEPPPPAWEPVPGLGAELWAGEPWVARLRAWLDGQALGPEARLVVRPRHGGGAGALVATGLVQAGTMAHAIVAAVQPAARPVPPLSRMHQSHWPGFCSV